jgi:hypothetical protein
MSNEAMLSSFKHETVDLRIFYLPIFLTYPISKAYTQCYAHHAPCPVLYAIFLHNLELRAFEPRNTYIFIFIRETFFIAQTPCHRPHRHNQAEGLLPQFVPGNL